MFRTLGKSKIAFVLAILFGISLFFFRSGSRYSNFLNSDSVVAKVSNTPISTTKFNRTMQMDINRFNQVLGKKITGDEIRAFQIHSLALSALINGAVFEDEFNDIKFKLDEKVIAEKTKEKIPLLYDNNNKLNEVYLNTFLQQQQLKIEDIVQIISYETRDQYFNEAFFNIKYPQYFTNKINNFNKHKRKISYVELKLEQIKSDEILQKDSSKLNLKLEDFYNINIDRYMDKEKRNIEYFFIDKKSLISNFETNDFEIKEYYDSNKKLFYENEKRSFIQFNFKTIEKAETFKKKIQNLDLQEIIKYADNNNLLFNEFENLESNEILDGIAEPLFQLRISDQSDIIETPLAKHIVILRSIKLPYQLKFAEVKDKIRKTITKIETDNYFKDLLSQISEKIVNGQSIVDIAKSFNLKLESIENLTKDYTKYDKSKEIIIKNLIENSFSSNKDFVSDLVNIDENLSFVFNVTKIELPKPIKYNKIKDVVYNDWENSKKIEEISLNTEKNKNNTTFISEIAEKYDVTINEITLSKNYNGLPINVTKKIFNSEQNQNIVNFYDNKFYIIKIEDVIISNDVNNNEIISINNDLRSSFGNELIKNKKISTNDKLVSALIEQY